MQIPIFSSTKFIQIKERSRLSQSEVAAQLNVSQTTVHNWYTGKKGCVPDANQIQVLAQVFSVEVNDFYEIVESILIPPEN